MRKSIANKRQSTQSFVSIQSENAKDFQNQKNKSSMSHHESEVWDRAKNHSLSYHQNQDSSFITQKPQKSSFTQNYNSFLADPPKRGGSVPLSESLRSGSGIPSHKSLIDGFISTEKKDTLPILKDKKVLDTRQTVTTLESENTKPFKNETFTSISLQPKDTSNFKRVYQPIVYAPRTKIDKSHSFTNYPDQAFSSNISRQISNPPSIKLGFTKEQSPFGRPTEPVDFKAPSKNTAQIPENNDYATAYSHEFKMDSKMLEQLLSNTSCNNSF